MHIYSYIIIIICYINFYVYTASIIFYIDVHARDPGHVTALTCARLRLYVFNMHGSCSYIFI